MARVNTYLNFQGQTEEAFTSYAKTFGTEIAMLSRYRDMPAAGPGGLPADELDLVMHAELPIIAGHLLMGTDMLRSMGSRRGSAITPPSAWTWTAGRKRIGCTAPCPTADPKDHRWQTCHGAPTGEWSSTATASAG